jgi:hypothetical protein
MAVLAPPPSPPILSVGDDDDGLRRFRMRFVQVSATILTLLVTAWFCTLGAIPAILSLMVAKHVLVAILVMGIGVDAPQEGGAAIRT